MPVVMSFVFHNLFGFGDSKYVINRSLLLLFMMMVMMFWSCLCGSSEYVINGD